MSLSIPYPTLGTGVSDSTKIDSNFSSVTAKFGNITDADIASAAGIAISKLSASYEYLPINVTLTDGTASNDVLYPLYNDSKGNWSVVAVQWATIDTGTPTGVIGIQWGVLDGSGTTSIAADFTSAATIDSVALVGANIASQGVDASPTTSTLTFGGAGVHRSLRFYMSTTDAAATSPIFVSLLLKRQIAT